VQRELAGVMAVALVASTLLLVAFRITRSRTDFLVLTSEVPEALRFSLSEYRLLTSVVARRDLNFLDLRFSWLERQGIPEFSKANASWQASQDLGLGMKDSWKRISRTNTVFAIAEEIGFNPRVLTDTVEMLGKEYTLVLYDFSDFEQWMIPASINEPSGQTVKPAVKTQYALLLNKSGDLAVLFEGCPRFFPTDDAITQLRIECRQGILTYGPLENATGDAKPISDLPRSGTLRFEDMGTDERINLVMSLDGKKIPFHNQYLHLVEVFSPKQSDVSFFFVG